MVVSLPHLFFFSLVYTEFQKNHEFFAILLHEELSETSFNLRFIHVLSFGFFTFDHH